MIPLFICLFTVFCVAHLMALALGLVHKLAKEELDQWF